MRKLSTLYPGRVTIDANNPDGTFKNEVTPGVSADGTPFEEQWQQDMWGFFAHVLNKAGVSADGVQENEATSQIYDGLETAARTLWTATSTTKGTVLPFVRGSIANGSDADHDIDFGARTFTFATGDGQAAVTAKTKQLDAAWAAGTNAGGLPTALSPANDTTYHCFALSNADGSVTDFGFDTSLTAANLLADAAVIAAGLTKYSRLASLLSDGSANFIPFFQAGKYFYWVTRITDVDGVDPGNTGTLFNVSVPNGVDAIAIISVHWVTSTSRELLITSPNETNTTPAGNFATLVSGGDLRRIVDMEAQTVSRQLRHRSDVTGSPTAYYVFTRGWIDHQLEG